ncbi:MAG: hypothetical protein R6V19_03650 [Armatimonadota bacterium]
MSKNTRVGVEIGDHFQTWPPLSKQIAQMPHENLGNFLLIYHSGRDEDGNEIPDTEYVRWAKTLSDAGIYFAFLYSQRGKFDDDTGSFLSPEILDSIRQTAGEYWVGDMIGETGGYASHFEGYFENRDYLPARVNTMQEAAEKYVEFVREKVEIDRGVGVETVMSVEATILHAYTLQAGVDLPCTELMPGQADINLAAVRGAARAFDRPEWGSHIAHEWYGGYEIEEPVTQKRLRNALYSSYLAGADYIYVESGMFEYRAYGKDYDYDSDICQFYRREIGDFAQVVEANPLPDEGPEVPMGLLLGNHEDWSDFGSCTVWNHFGNPRWRYGDAEMAWEEFAPAMYEGSPWHKTTIRGDQDFSTQPPCGQYDVVPIFAGAQALKPYDCLMMLGYNTMTPDIYADLVEYVRSGGHLLIGLPHFRTNSDRSDDLVLLNDGDLSELCGVRIRPGATEFDAGFKFTVDETAAGWRLPKIPNMDHDPMCSNGAVSIARVEEAGARCICETGNEFRYEPGSGVMYENRIGEGSVVLFATYDYPASQGMKKLVQVVIDAAKAAHHRDPLVLADDSIRYAVYRENGDPVVFAYNTHFDLPQSIRIKPDAEEITATLDPGTLKVLRP